MYLERKAMPKSSKLTYKREVEMNQKLHRDRLRSIKPSIDNKPPKKHPHLRRNLKREQMMEERFATIERENRILLSKMSDIMQHNTLDNINTSMRYSHSLNKGYRKRELQRITAENQAILRRIQAREPVYNHFQWEEERLVNEKYMTNIMEYPSMDMSASMMAAGGPLRTADGLLEYEEGEDGYGGPLEPMDEEYKRESRERARRPSPGSRGAGSRGKARLEPLEPSRPSRGSAGSGSPMRRRLGPESDGDRPASPDGVGEVGSAVQQIRARSRGADRGLESRGVISRGSEAGDLAEAALYSVGRKLGEDYFMVAQSHSGDITLYNPFSSETHALTLPGGFKTPANLDQFRYMVSRVDRKPDGSGFCLADKPTQ